MKPLRAGTLAAVLALALVAGPADDVQAEPGPAIVAELAADLDTGPPGVVLEVDALTAIAIELEAARDGVAVPAPPADGWRCTRAVPCTTTTDVLALDLERYEPGPGPRSPPT